MKRKITPKYVEYLQMLERQKYISLNTEITNEDGWTYELGDTIPSDEPSAEDVVVEEMNREMLIKIIKKLSPKHSKIILMRFGFEGNPMTLEEIGKSFGVTRERIRQIENTALKKLVEKLEELNVKDKYFLSWR